MVGHFLMDNFAFDSIPSQELPRGKPSTTTITTTTHTTTTSLNQIGILVQGICMSSTMFLFASPTPYDLTEGRLTRSGIGSQDRWLVI